MDTTAEPNKPTQAALAAAADRSDADFQQWQLESRFSRSTSDHAPGAGKSTPQLQTARSICIPESYVIRWNERNSVPLSTLDRRTGQGSGNSRLTRRPPHAPRTEENNES